MLLNSSDETEAIGEIIGRQLRGGELIELIGDIGAGKTTFVKGLAKGLDIAETPTSPSFTINCNYSARNDMTLRHYDFYRLTDPGIISMEISEAISDPKSITVIEWGENLYDLLPNERIIITINYLPKTGRDVQLSIPTKYAYIQNLNFDSKLC